jgi:nitrite reductase/ring-hydroxylating ferredoxin subunit
MFTRVASRNEIPEGRGLRVQVGDVEIGLFVLDGQVYALDNLCPHAGVPLHDGDIEGSCVLCPGHGWEFDLRTGEGPFGERVQIFPIKLEGDEIWVDAESPYEG